VGLRVALVTCSTLPDLDPDDRPVRDALIARGIEATAPVWDDASVDWEAFDLAVIRSTWDYPARRDEFVEWAGSVSRLANPADIVAWNTDKRYLRELAAVGIPVVPTQWLAPGEIVALPAGGRHVVKPAVGAGSIDAAAYAMHDEHERDLAAKHAARLLAAGRTVMVQPYVDAIDESGETALMYFRGEFSHAVSKEPMLAEERGLEPGRLFKSETITPRKPSDAEFELGRSVLAAVPGGSDRLAYARVDMVPDAEGRPMLIELELTEPSLFLAYAPGAAERFARVLAAMVEDSREK
jgi:hypothetical protein